MRILLLQEGLQDFVDLWACPDHGRDSVALVALTSMHTLALSPAHMQGWMAAVVRALRSGVRTVVVPAGAPPDTLPRLIHDQLALAKPSWSS
jgi:hypothetical protein